MEFTAVAEIVASRVNRHRHGMNVKFELKTLDSSPRKLNYDITLENPNPEVVRRGQAKMAALCLACRVPMVTDTDQLHNRMIVVSYARNGYVTRVMAVCKPSDLQDKVLFSQQHGRKRGFIDWLLDRFANHFPERYGE